MLTDQNRRPGPSRLYRGICQSNGYLLHVDGPLEGTKMMSYVEFEEQFVNVVGQQNNVDGQIG